MVVERNESSGAHMINIVSAKTIFEYGPKDETELLKTIEKIARTCYKSEGLITEDNSSAEHMIDILFEREHLAMIEHIHVTYRVVCNRGVSHEIVRHRLANYAQESTRYCNYNKDKFGNKITVIDPKALNMDKKQFGIWLTAIKNAQACYMDLIEAGAPAQVAREVLPNALKTEIVMTMNLREWLHFFKMRRDMAAHPQMREVADLIYEDMKERYPYMCSKYNEKLMQWIGR